MGPVTMPHVQLALSSYGYKLDFESIVLTMQMKAAPRRVAGPRALVLEEAPAEMSHDGMRESWTGFEPMWTRGLVADEQVGQVGWVMLSQVSEKLGAPCLNIWSLGVSREQRRHGIGLALVEEAMRRGFAMGARFCSVGTQLWNAPAHATYAAAGFRPHCIVLGRKLTPTDGA